MDLNSAIEAAEQGAVVRDDRTMAADWTVRYVAKEKLLYYFNPHGEQAHRVRFTDQHRASFSWRIVDEK